MHMHNHDQAIRLQDRASGTWDTVDSNINNTGRRSKEKISDGVKALQILTCTS